MEAAVKAVEGGMALRAAARLHNVPLETTRRREWELNVDLDQLLCSM